MTLMENTRPAGEDVYVELTFDDRDGEVFGEIRDAIRENLYREYSVLGYYDSREFRVVRVELDDSGIAEIGIVVPASVADTMIHTLPVDHVETDPGRARRTGNTEKQTAERKKWHTDQ